MDAHTQSRINEYLANAEAARNRADAAFATSDQHSARFAGGQPILVGHHSEKSARRDQERSHNAMRRALKDLQAEKWWTHKAEAARRQWEKAHDPGVIQRRIQRKQTELAALEHRLQGATHPDRREQLREWIDQTKQALGDSRRELEESGAKVWGREDFTPGDFALHDRVLYEVKRVNPKSLTIPSIVGSPSRGVYRITDNPYPWTDTLPYNKIQGRASAAQVNEKTAGS